MLVLGHLLVAVGQLPTVPARDFPEAVQRKVVAATVKVVNGDKQGSGAIVGREGPFAYVLTAAHVVGTAENVEVHVFTAGSYPKADKVYRGNVLARAAGPDLAVVRLTSRDPLPDPLVICPPAAIPRGKNLAALSVGCGPGEAPTPVAETLLERKQIRRDGESERCWAWEAARKPEGGRSGGPLLDTAGRLIGVASGHGTERGYYAHVEEIHPFLRRNGFRWLYEEEPR